MCMIDNGDGCVTMIRDEPRRARKEHKCSECCRTIRPGETYHFEWYSFEGDRHSHRTCAHCEVVRDWLSAECGGWLYGAVEEDIREHVFEGDYGMGVARLAVGMKTLWQRRNGDLLPIPRAPMTTLERRQAEQAAIDRARATLTGGAQ